MPIIKITIYSVATMLLIFFLAWIKQPRPDFSQSENIDRITENIQAANYFCKEIYGKNFIKANYDGWNMSCVHRENKKYHHKH